MPYLSVAKRGFTSKFDLWEIVNAILYKLKSGCQWHFLTLGHLFNGDAPSWNTVFQHYRKWCKKDEWRKAYAKVLSSNKDAIDLSHSHINGSHTPALRDGEYAEYRDIRNEGPPMCFSSLTIKVSLCPSNPLYGDALAHES